MGGKMRSDITVSVNRQQRYSRFLPAEHKLYLGIDIGSTSSDVVLLSQRNEVLFADYARTMGRALETAYRQLTQLFERINPSNIVLAAVTGSAARQLAGLLDVPYINEVPAQAGAIHHLYPAMQRATIIEMGGQDSKLIFLDGMDGQAQVRDFALNTVCAAGTGSFLDQQAQRLGVRIEDEFSQRALESTSPPRIAGRCSVFAKSDMIHLQQQATPVCDIIAGLCLGLAGNLKSNLGCGREFTKPIVFTGGVAANIGVVRALEQTLGLAAGELVVPQEHFFTGAIGAILLAKQRPGTANGRIELKKLRRYVARQHCAAASAARRDKLVQPSLPRPPSRVYDELLYTAAEPIEAYLGVDVGSISTNVAVIDRHRRLLAKAYLMTAGRPLEAVRQGLRIVGEKVVNKVKILGAATTGSGRYLTGDFIGADIVINEITAQAAGAAIVNPKVDTIFEIGGQDSKYISLKNGVVVDFEMNHACAAGTGSFLEEQAQRLGINIEEEFAELAFKSQAPLKLGERCTVFMESDLLNFQQQGASLEDLVAGLSYSIVTNYLNRVVGRRRIGDNICFQGGTAFNKAVWSAFEKITGKPIMVPDHHEVTGALGAAAIAAEHTRKTAETQGRAVQSKFRGFDNLVHINYTVKSFTCQHCPNHCEIKQVRLPDSDPLYYGCRCDRYNLKKQAAPKCKRLDAFEYRRQLLFKYAGLNDRQTAADRATVTIGIPLALSSWQLLPLFARFFGELGCRVILSGQTDKQTIRTGVESVTAQTCFPVKVAYGHVAELLEKGLDYVFLPSIVSMFADYPQNSNNHLCPYVQALPYQIKAAFADKMRQADASARTKILTTPIRLGEGDRLLRRSFIALGKQLSVSVRTARAALKTALAAQADFERAVRKKGREILDGLRPEQKLFVLISRPYNGCDVGFNLNLPGKLADLGLEAIPMDMLDLKRTKLTDPALHSKIYWKYGQNILRAAEIISRHPQLYAIYLSNFSCGPDSFLTTFFKDIMGPKPCLQLELDEHSADAGVITRLEAFLDSLKHHRLSDSFAVRQPRSSAATARRQVGKRTLYIPWMGDCAFGIAACFRAYGQPAEVIPMADQTTLLHGRKFTSGKECLPCTITAGDMLKLIKQPGFDPAGAAFFMPGSSGPCRFGMYSCLHRLILEYAGIDGSGKQDNWAGRFEDIPVISPNQDSNFYKELRNHLGIRVPARLTKDVWVAAVGIDLLRKTILRIRPYAADPDYARMVYKQAVASWTEAVQGRADLSEMRNLMAEITERFAAIKTDWTIPKPTVGVVGEIYVRSHRFANQDVISRLEQLGAACDLAPLAEWIYYTNFTCKQEAKRRRRLGTWLENIIVDHFQHRIEKQLAAPLEERFGLSAPLAEGPVEHVIELARPYLHPSFEGEAVLSVGKTIEYHHRGFGGVVNVMPFTCMPSTIVSTQTMRLSADCNNMPILNLSFDGQEDPTLTTRLEAFVEQVRQRQKTDLIRSSARP